MLEHGANKSQNQIKVHASQVHVIDWTFALTTAQEILRLQLLNLSLCKNENEILHRK